MNKLDGHRRLSLNTQMHIATQLSFLLKSQISLSESLELLYIQSKKPKERLLFETISSGVRNGNYLSVVLEQIKPSFSPLVIQVIRTGEESGMLDVNLTYISQELKKRRILIQKVIGALVYPLCIGVATLGVTGMIIVYVFPKIMPLFANPNIRLPISTKIVVMSHGFIAQHGITLLLVALISICLFVVMLKKSLGLKIYCQRLIMHIPVAGNLLRRYEAAQTFRTLSLLLTSNVSLQNALISVSRGSINTMYKMEYEKASEHIMLGLPLSSFFSDQKLFPGMMSSLLSIGERSGNLSEVSRYISEYFERELDETIKNFSSILEPALMIIMGLTVGFIAIAIISPVYEITQSLR